MNYQNKSKASNKIIKLAVLALLLAVIPVAVNQVGKVQQWQSEAKTDSNIIISMLARVRSRVGTPVANPYGDVQGDPYAGSMYGQGIKLDEEAFQPPRRLFYCKVYTISIPPTKNVMRTSNTFRYLSLCSTLMKAPCFETAPEAAVSCGIAAPPAKYGCSLRLESGNIYSGEYVNECARNDKYGKYSEPTCGGDCSKKYTFYACGLPGYTCIVLPKQYFAKKTCEIDLKRDPLYKRKYYEGWCFEQMTWCTATCNKVREQATTP